MQEHLTLSGISTDIGEQLIAELKDRGWKVVKEYSRLAFDKGIDYDAYSLQRNGERVECVWDNWTEWEIIGPHAALTQCPSYAACGQND